MKISAILLLFLFPFLSLNAQVGVGTSSPNSSAILDIDVSSLAATAKKGMLIPRVALTSATDVTTIPSPATGLLVFNTTAAGVNPNNVMANAFHYWNGTKWNVLVDRNSLDALGIPRPAVFTLGSNMSNFLNGIVAGGTQTLTNVTQTVNKIDNLVFNSTNSTITFPVGTYQITFTYEATHNNTGCTISSYFVDFPGGTRIHSTASHLEGGLSNHGGNITYTVDMPSSNTWTIALGRGQSGNCTGTGMSLIAPSTQISVIKMNQN